MDEREALSLARKYADENDISQVIYYYRLVNEGLLDEEDWFQYAKALHEAGHSQEALENLNTIILLNPEMDRFYSLRAHVKREIDLEHEALEDLNRAIGINPDSYYHWYTRALVQLDLGNLEEAAGDYLEAVEREDEDSVSSTWYELGNVYMQIGEYEKAVEAIEKAIGNGATSIPIYYARLAECYQNSEQLEMAIQAMEQAFEMSIYLHEQSDGGHQFIYQRGKYSNVAIDTHKTHMLTRCLYTHPLAVLYDQQGETEKAIDILNIGIEYFPTCSYLYQERAGLYQKSGYDYIAINDLLRASEMDPDNDYIHYLLGAAYEEMGQKEKASWFYQRAIQLEPDDDFYYFQRGNLYYSEEKYRQAESDFSKGIHLWEDSCYYLKRAMVRIKLGKYSDSITDLLKALELDDELHDNLEWLATHAEALYNLGQFNQAQKMVQYGLSLESENQVLIDLNILIQISLKPEC